MPTNFEDIPTPLCYKNILGKFSNPELVYVNIEFAIKLEKWLHVAREERDDALTHERDAQKGAKTNAEVARRLAASNYELRLESDKANQKCQLVDELVKIMEQIIERGDDAYEEHARGCPALVDYWTTCNCGTYEEYQLAKEALSKAAKTL